jgi:hypothetical protein
MKELVAVRRCISRFANELRGHTVCLYEDNQAVVAIIKNRTSSSPLLMNELRLLMALLEQLDIRLVPRYIRSDLNPADFFSRPTDREAWTLSPSVQRMLMQRAQAIFRISISLDAFACPQSKVTSRFASRHFAPEALAEDGLLLEWSGEVIWLNPPWSLLPDVICKLREERPAPVLIVPMWPSQKWWSSSSCPRSVSCRSAAGTFAMGGAQESTKVSYSGKWIRFVNFCTLILPFRVWYAAS